jgi:hypothetical protein
VDETGGSRLASCNGTAANGEPVDTCAPGSHTFTVDASDHVGNTSQASATYEVRCATGNASVLPAEPCSNP